MQRESALAVVVVVSILIYVRAAVASEPGVTPTGRDDQPWHLRYNRPADKWEEALPVGNGRLGAMVFDTTARELIQVNEDTLWTGIPRVYAHPGASKYLPMIRELLFDGKQGEAEGLAMKHFMSVPLRQERYQPYGDLILTLPGHDQVQDYRRELDLDGGVVTVQYRLNDANFTRRVFCSAIDQVLVVQLDCDRPGHLTFDALIVSPHSVTECIHHGDNTLRIVGQLREYQGRFQVRPSCLKHQATLLARA